MVVTVVVLPLGRVVFETNVVSPPGTTVVDRTTVVPLVLLNVLVVLSPERTVVTVPVAVVIVLGVLEPVLVVVVPPDPLVGALVPAEPVLVVVVPDEPPVLLVPEPELDVAPELVLEPVVEVAVAAEEEELPPPHPIAESAETAQAIVTRVLNRNI